MMRQLLVGAFTGLLIAAGPTSWCVFILMWVEEGLEPAMQAFKDLVERAWPEEKK